MAEKRRASDRGEVTSSCTDEVARALFIQHEKTCNERMERIETYMADSTKSRTDMHKRINALVFSLLFGAASICASAAGYLYVEQQKTNQAKIERLEKINPYRGGR